MKSGWIATLAVSLALVLAPGLSDAKRLGGGKSTGMQRDMPARTAPDAPPAKPATPAQASPTTPAGTAAAPAAAPKRSWLGPLAGLAAGLGLAALASHLGFGEEMANFMMLALLALVAIVAVRWLMGRMSGAPQPAAAGGSAPRSPGQVAWPAAAPAATPQPAGPTAAFVPASFDSEGFARIAKTIFVRLQAANDAGDLDDLRRFTTTEMFAELKMDLQDRAGAAQQTEVVHVDAAVLDVADDGERQVVSVRFSGKVREAAGAAPADFDEVWHLVKPHDDSKSWVIAGIEQLAARAA